MFDFVSVIPCNLSGYCSVTVAQSETAFKCLNLKCWSSKSANHWLLLRFSRFKLDEWEPFQWRFLTPGGQPSYQFMYILQLTRTPLLFAISLIYMLPFYVRRHQHVVTPFVRLNAIVNDWYIFSSFSRSVCLEGKYKRKGNDSQSDSSMKMEEKISSKSTGVYFAIEISRRTTWKRQNHQLAKCCCSRWSK